MTKITNLTHSNVAALRIMVGDGAFDSVSSTGIGVRITATTATFDTGPVDVNIVLRDAIARRVPGYRALFAVQRKVLAQMPPAPKALLDALSPLTNSMGGIRNG